MIRHIFCLWTVICLLLFSSCNPACNRHLDPSNYGEAFRANNEILFLNSECDHTWIHEPLSGTEDPSVAAIYHETSCKWGGCDYEAHYTPHVFLFRDGEIPTARAYYKENGYLYHSFRMACEECQGGITLHVLCQTQDAACGAGEGAIHAPAECFDGCDWQDIFRDTPYRILVRSDV